MRLAAAALLTIACITSAAIAQDAPTPPPERPRITWDEQPGGNDYVRFYPRQAMDQNVSGAAVLCCSVNARRRLDCTSPIDWPQNYGFGRATVAISGEFRVSEESYAALQASGDMSVKRVIRWFLPEYEMPGYEQAVAILNQASCPAVTVTPAE